MKRFGSVPDLRGRDRDRSREANSEHHVHKESTRELASRGRKKYKAPPPPGANALVLFYSYNKFRFKNTKFVLQLISNGSSLDSWEMSGENLETPVVRKARLFKTRAEMKNKAPSPQSNRRNYGNNLNNDEGKRYRSRSKEPLKKQAPLEPKLEDPAKNDRTRKPNGNFKPVMLAEMQRSKSLPEFQAELREATQRVRSSRLNQSRQESEKSAPVNLHHPKSNNVQRYSLQVSKENKLKTLDPNACKKEHIKYKMKQIEKTHQDIEKPKLPVTKRSTSIDVIRGRASRKESTTPEQSPMQTPREKSSDTREQPSKTFYFGMDESSAQPNSFNSNVVDHFALSLQKHNCLLPTQTYSASDLSSEIEVDESQVSTNGIALHLRPILPKKQLEIPRFSPAAAWRLLTAFDSNPPPSTVSDEGPVLIEDRIEKLARQPALLSMPGVGPRSSHDKSGDSGISGDAGPPGFEENSDPVLPNPTNNIQVYIFSYDLLQI